MKTAKDSHDHPEVQASCGRKIHVCGVQEDDVLDVVSKTDSVRLFGGGFGT